MVGEEKVRESGHLDVLGSIPVVYRKAVLEQCERRVLRKGSTIWKQGDRVDQVAFLISGTVMSSYQSRNGKTGTNGFWCAGDVLGAANLSAAGTQQMTVRCLEDCVIYALPCERFRELVRRFPELAEAVIRALSARLRWASDLALTLQTQPTLERIGAVLLVLSERFGVPGERGVYINLAVTNEDLAAIAGVSRQFTNATLQRLQKRGLLGTQKRHLVLIDPRALEALVYHS